MDTENKLNEHSCLNDETEKMHLFAISNFLFQFFFTKTRHCYVSGIANALDLTDRILPRLQARPNCKPELLNFAPYSKDQISAIIKDRLKDVCTSILAV